MQRMAEARGRTDCQNDTARHLGFQADYSPLHRLVLQHHEKEKQMTEAEERGLKATAIAVQYGSIDGAHHKAWVIDQMVRALTGDMYEKTVTEARDGEDGPETYDWDCGIAP